MNPWIVIGAFTAGLFVGMFVGVLLGVTGERVNADAAARARRSTSVNELERLRARRMHPTSKPNPWN